MARHSETVLRRPKGKLVNVYDASAIDVGVQLNMLLSYLRCRLQIFDLEASMRFLMPSSTP